MVRFLADKWSKRSAVSTGCVAFVPDSERLHEADEICADRVTRAQFKMLSVRRVVLWQAAAIACGITLALGLSRFFPIVSFIEVLQERVMNWGAWAGICYPLLFAACSILLLPGGILAVGGGFFFGLWWGFLIVLAGNIMATGISFALSRFVAGRWFSQKLARNPTLKALGPAVERESWKIILLSQLHPLFPTSLLNYFYGLTRIRFGTYMFWASMGRMPGLFFYAYVGTLGQFAVRIMRGRNYPRMVEYWIWGGAFITTVLLFVVLGRIAYHAIQPRSDGAAEEMSKDGLKERRLSR